MENGKRAESEKKVEIEAGLKKEKEIIDYLSEKIGKGSGLAIKQPNGSTILRCLCGEYHKIEKVRGKKVVQCDVVGIKATAMATPRVMDKWFGVIYMILKKMDEKKEAEEKK